MYILLLIYRVKVPAVDRGIVVDQKLDIMSYEKMFILLGWSQTHRYFRVAKIFLLFSHRKLLGLVPSHHENMPI